MSIDDVFFNTVYNSIWSEDPQQQQNLEWIQFCVVLWQFLTLRFLIVIPFLPLLFIALQILDETFVLWSDSDQFLKILPSLIRHPLVRFWLGHTLQTGISLQEEVQFALVQLLLLILDHNGHLEGEHEFVLFEDTQTSVFVNIQCKFVDDTTESRLQHWILLGISQGIVEHNQVTVQTVLVHLTDNGQTAHDEEQDGTSLGGWSIGLPCHLDLLLSNLTFFNVLGDFD